MSTAVLERRRAPALPAPRGPWSQWLVEHLSRPPSTLPSPPPLRAADPLTDEDLHLALYLAYELHYRGFDGVDSGWEWEPSLLAARARLEAAFLEALRDESPVPASIPDIGEELRAVIASGDGPSLSRHVEERGTLEQVRELAVHRSAYQLKEADPHTWALPRLGGRAKAAMVEIQADEYGEGVEEEMHASLFARTMRALDLDDAYGAYLDRIPGVTLATVNLISLLGLHRRWRGALVGHLALFEMTSVVPMGRYAAAAERLGLGEDGRRFYDVHVLADAHHEVVAVEDLAGGLVAEDPDLAADVSFGARALMAVEGRFARAVLDAWSASRSSLRPI